MDPTKNMRMTAMPWQAKLDDPQTQPFYMYSKDRDAWAATVASKSNLASSLASSIANIAIFSWNIDCMLPFATSRMSAAIEHLKSIVARDGFHPSTANVIMLIECVAGDLQLIATDPWVQQNFHLLDLDHMNWGTYYGTTMLVDRRLTIQQCFRVHFSKTDMGRDGLFVDVELAGGMGTSKVLRLCATHLESLARSPAYRPFQLALCARYMRDSSVAAAILAGDLNAIQDFDLTLHSESGLKDAYLELGGKEGHAKGFTWGQQAATKLRQKFGLSRMDKVLFCGDELSLQSFETFGAGIEVTESKERQQLVAEGAEQPWITDHLGIKAVFDCNVHAAGSHL
nr:hypothetical protein CFP56_09014 [Quercus suber]